LLLKPVAHRPTSEMGLRVGAWIKPKQGHCRLSALLKGSACVCSSKNLSNLRFVDLAQWLNVGMDDSGIADFRLLYTTRNETM